MLAYTDETDAALARLTLRGDSRAYDALIARHRKLLYAIAYAELLDDDAADDVVQDALVRAYERLGKLRAPGPLSSWIARVVVSCAWAHDRSTSRGRAAIDQLDPPPTEFVPDTPLGGSSPLLLTITSTGAATLIVRDITSDNPAFVVAATPPTPAPHRT